MKLFEIIISVLLVLILIVSIACLIVSLKRKSTLSNDDLKKTISEIVNDVILEKMELQNKLFTEKLLDKIEYIEKSINDLNKANNDFQLNLIKQNTSEFEKLNNKFQEINDKIFKQQIENITKLNEAFKDINKLVNDNNEKSIKALNENLDAFSKIIKEKLDIIDKSVVTNLDNIRKDNNEKLDKIQGIVDEKLQKSLEERLNNSFKNVIEQIGGVNKAIGEIKGLASDVSSLKTVFANVKSKGIIGEVMLGNLIRDILSPNQYEENVKTKANSNDAVEYAIKMPSSVNGEFIYLPIDSKFPTESYNKILEAIEKANKDEVDSYRKELKNNIKSFAKDISSKYIDEPNTTGFAIMFLPIEGLYAEVINMGLFEEIQRDYKVCICGPSTFAALLNALQMGFKTLIIQKKSAEVFKLLKAIKTEFNNFANVLEKTQSKMEQAGKELNNLVGTRTRAIQRKLKDIEELPVTESDEILNNN